MSAIDLFEIFMSSVFCFFFLVKPDWLIKAGASLKGENIEENKVQELSRQARFVGIAALLFLILTVYRVFEAF